MWGDVNNILGLGKDLPSGHFFLLTNDEKSDISFLVSSLLHFYFKKHGKVVFVHLAQDFTHYQTIASKCGVSLKNQCDFGNLACIDGFDLLRRALDDKITVYDSESQSERDKITRDDKENPFSFVFSSPSASNHEHRLKHLYLKVRNTFNELQNGSKTVLILIDDITLLLGLGATVTEVYDFVHYCQALCLQQGFNKEGAGDGTLAVLAHEGANVDSEYEKLVKSLMRFSSVHIRTAGLSTGYSKDIHGEITFHKLNFGSGPSESTTMHYKLGDRGVKLFAKGMATGLM